MTPLQVGPYLIDRKIGSGGMGNVYLGHHAQTGQVAAIKELPAALAREEGFVLRFNREIEALRKLDNPHIVKLYESGSDDKETYYYSMEYVDGETLTSKLRRERRLPWNEAIQIAIQICLGLKHAHDNGIIHRDLKPSNLMIDKNGTVKLTDFGVAQVFSASPLTVTGAVIGTAEFMPPEQVEGRRTDRRSDLYALGAVLYTMIVGHPPFSGSSAAEVMQKQRYGRFDAPRNYVPDIPMWLDDIICQLLEKEPEKRLPDAYVVSKKLQEVVKKVELKNSMSKPVSSDDDETRVDHPIGSERGIGATLMRDLVKAEVSRGEPDTPLGRLLDNTWVLVITLLLVLFGIVWFWPSGNSRGTVQVQRSEADRILQMARLRWKQGDHAEARRQLDALRAVIASDPEEKTTLKAIDRLLASIRDQMSTYPQAFVREAISRADDLVKEGEHQKAIAALSGIITIYENDQTMDELVREARIKRDAVVIPNPFAPQTATPEVDTLTPSPPEKQTAPKESPL